MVQSFEKTSLRSDSFDALCEAASGWDQQYLQMAPGQFEGRIEQTQVGTTQIMRESWNRKIRYQGTAPNGGFGFALPLVSCGTGKWVGRNADPNTVIVQAPGNEADFTGPDYWDAIVLGIAEEDAHAIAGALSGQDAFDCKFHTAVILQPDVAEALRKFGQGFLQRSKTASLEDDKAIISQWSEQLTKLFLWEIIHAQQAQDSEASPAKAARMVKKANDLVLGNQTRSLGLTEICDQLGVGLRTLHYAFKDVTGMSPATWLRRVRLNQAHKALLNCSADDILVKQVALDHGFLHFTHFAEQYRKLFGRLPSETLRLS